MTADSILAQMLRPVDWGRRALFQQAHRIAPAPVTALLRSRAHRTLWLGSAGIILAGIFSVMFPIAMLAVTPLVFGVPHLLSDIRYLVVKPGFHRKPWFLAALAVPLVAYWFPKGYLLAPLLWFSGLFLGTGGSSTISKTTPPLVGTRFACALIALLALTSFWLKSGYSAALAMAHMHNYIAVFVLLALRASKARVVLGLGAVFLFLSALTLGGTFDTLLFVPRALTRLPLGDASISVDDAVAQLAPFASPTMAIRLVALFAFAQSVHYVVWLRVMPDEQREREGLRSFASSVRALRADVGPILLLLAFAVWLAFFGWGLFEPESARVAYLRMAGFHGHLEIAFLVHVFVHPARNANVGHSLANASLPPTPP
jgi:hypothetical protein